MSDEEKTETTDGQAEDREPTPPAEPAEDDKKPRKKAGRPAGTKKPKPSEGIAPLGAEPRKTAGEYKDLGSALKRDAERYRTNREAYLKEHPESAIAELPEDIFAGEQKPREYPRIPAEMMERLIGSTVSVAASSLGVGKGYAEIEKTDEHKKSVEECAAAWSDLSVYYPIFSPKLLAVIAVGTTTVGVMQPVGKLYLEKKKAEREGRPMLPPGQEEKAT